MVYEIKDNGQTYERGEAFGRSLETIFTEFWGNWKTNSVDTPFFDQYPNHSDCPSIKIYEVKND